MGFNMTKEAYTKLIEEDLDVLNKHMPDSLELDHIKVVLTSSIDCYYPSVGNPADSKPANCAIFDVSDTVCPACYGAGVVPGDINGCYHCAGTGKQTGR